MNKKDRIATVVSVTYLLWPLILVMGGEGMQAIIFLAPVIVYWGYRFIKGDISFLKNEGGRGT